MMNSFKHVIHNTGKSYNFTFAKHSDGFLEVEIQDYQTHYAFALTSNLSYLDSRNAAKYGGYNVFHMRVGYELEGFEVWMNVINAVDRLLRLYCGQNRLGVQLYACGVKAF
jgi:hypothetical protein